MNIPVPQPKPKGNFLWGLLILLAGLLAATPWARRVIKVEALLHTAAPSEKELDAALKKARQPWAFLRRLWNTRKLPHQAFVMEQLRSAEPQAAWAKGVLLEACCHPDEEIRKSALALLKLRKASRWTNCARFQTKDPDPELRLTGALALGSSKDARVAGTLVSLLEDPDPQTAAAAAAGLRKITGKTFGPFSREASLLKSSAILKPERDRIQAAFQNEIAQWKAWWSAASNRFPALPRKAIRPPCRFQEIVRSESPIRFQLSDISGRLVRAGQFRGRPVFLNFWAMWCSACMEELPNLIALRRRMGEEFIILGVCIGGAVRGSAPQNVEQFRARLERFLKAHGVNYPILFDLDGAVAAQFRGGELPTNVILDRTGRLRRRFIGGRSPETLEKMFRTLTAAF